MNSILEDSVDKNSPDDNLVDTLSEMFTDEHALDYSSPPLWDDYDDELSDLKTVNDNTYDDPFDFKEEKIKDSKILIDELDSPESSDFLPFPEYDSVFYEDFSEVDALPSTDNEDKVFNPEVPGLGALLSFSSENEEKVFNPGILTSKRVHTSLLPELSHRGTKAFKVIKILESPMEIFPCSYGEDIRVLDVPCLHFYPLDQLNLKPHKDPVSQSKASNVDSSEIASAVSSAVTSAMSEMLKKFQPPAPASVKAVEESCVTCGGAHSYRQCPATNGNTCSGFHDNIQGYVSAVAAANYNQGNAGYRPQSVANQIRPPGFAQPNVQNNQPRNTIANPKGELKTITTKGGLVLDGPSVPMPPPFINLEKDEREEETSTDPKHGEFTIKVPPPPVQKAKPPLQRNFVIHQRDPRHPNIPYPSRMNQEKQKEKDEVQIHKFWQMFKHLHINISLVDALILIPKYQKMLKSLLSNKEKLLEMENTPLSENCSAVILKKLPEKLGDPGKFLIPCGFNKLKCKALADLGASINLMPLSVWKKLGLPELIPTRMTLELANQDIFTPKGIARDVFVSVGKFTFPADFIIVDYESDPRVPLILGRPFLWTVHALIDVYGEEMILRDGDERLILNMRHDTSNYSNEPQRESINMIDIYNVSNEEYLEDLFSTTHLSGNPTFSSHIDLTSPEVINPSSGNPTFSSPTLISFEESELIWEEFEAYLASDPFPPRNSDPSSPPSPYHNSLSGSTTSSTPSLPIPETSDYSLEEFADELALIESFPPGNDDMTPEDDEDNLFDLEPDNDYVYDALFDFKEEKIKESKLLIDELNELDPPRSCDLLPFPECDSVFYEDFSKVDALSSTNNEDKVFNPGILIHENLFEVTNLATPDKKVKKATNASLILEDLNPSLCELPFHKEVPGLGILLSFSSESEEKVFNPGILTSKGVHTTFLLELSHRNSKAFKVIKIVENPMEIFP
ncbi:reverse transcriptase domain-containing protein [Tanacetum coccineum]